MQPGSLRTAIRHRDPDQDVLYIALRVLDKGIKIAVVIKDAGIQEFEFRLIFAPSAVLFHQFRVRKLRLGILVQILHIGVRRRAVKIEVALFHILAVIAFVTRKPEKPFVSGWDPARSTMPAQNR